MSLGPPPTASAGTNNAFSSTSIPAILSAISVGDFVTLYVGFANNQSPGVVTIGGGITCLTAIGAGVSNCLFVFAGIADSALAALSGTTLTINCSDGFVWSNICVAVAGVDAATPYLTGPDAQNGTGTATTATSQAIAGGGAYLVLLRGQQSSGGGGGGGGITTEATTADGALTTQIDQLSFFGDGPIGWRDQASTTNPTGTMSGTLNNSDEWMTVAFTLKPGGGGGPSNPPLLGKAFSFAQAAPSFAMSRALLITSGAVPTSPPLLATRRALDAPRFDSPRARVVLPPIAASAAPLIVPRKHFTDIVSVFASTPMRLALPLRGDSPPLMNQRAPFVPPADSRAASPVTAVPSAPAPTGGAPLFISRMTYALVADSGQRQTATLPPRVPADSPPLLARVPGFSPPIPGWLARSLPGYPVALPPDAPPLLPARSTFGALADARVPFSVTAIPPAPPPVVPDAPPLLGRAALFVAPPDAPPAGQRFGVPVSGPIPDAPPLMARLRAATERAPEFTQGRPASIPPFGPDTPPILARWRPADAVAVEYRRNPASLPPVVVAAPPLVARARLFEQAADASPARGAPTLPAAAPPGQPPLMNRAARFEPVADSFQQRPRAQIPQSVDRPPLTVRAWSFTLPPPWFNARVAALPPLPPPGAPPLIQQRYQFTPPAFTFFVPRGALIPVSGQRTIIGRFHASVGARVKHAAVPPRNHEAEAGPKQRKASK